MFPESLPQRLRDARRRTRLLTRDLEGPQLFGPKLAIVNPVLWELGHVAWFQELWCLRLRSDESLSDSILDRADALYDSAKVAHDTRWHLPLPSRAETIRYMEEVRDRVVDLVNCEAYFVLLSVFHEDMHDEAFLITRQTLSYPVPPSLKRTDAPPVNVTTGGDVSIPGGEYTIGSTADEGFIFDNEKWAHTVSLPAFRIARSLVTQKEFLNFVEDTGSPPPVYWKRDEKDGWLRRHFDRWIPLESNRPVSNISWFEADAYCRWAGRRLPAEFEWEIAARRGGCDQMFGSVWQWTSSDFLPYDGFSEDPYKEYSSPWFGTHKSLRGGAWSTRSRIMRPAYRNFYTPDRCDIWAGLRTCAIDS